MTDSTTSYFTSRPVSRRQFIAGMATLLGLGLLSPTEAKKALPGAFYWMDLESGLVQTSASGSPAAGLPGSLMKLVAAAALTEDRLVSLEETVECRGWIERHGHRYHCPVAHGNVNLIEALGYSCNGYFAQATEALPGETFLSYARRLGLDRAAAGVPSGRFPKKAGERTPLYALGLSPALQPNPLQLLRMSALIACRGASPLLRQTPADARSMEPPVEWRRQTWDVLAQGMHLACRLGTGKHLDSENALHAAVKTGTAPYGSGFQSWIVGYFPVEEPRYAFCLKAHSGTSQEAAVPQARSHLFSRRWM